MPACIQQMGGASFPPTPSYCPFPSQGDRMLEFATALLVVFLYPDSLLLPAIHGFTVQLFAVVLGTIVGDWVDVYPRMKGERQKLLCM